MSAPRFYIKTWGCQMNSQDSDKMAAMLRKEGYQPAATAGEADLVLLNTCSVREKSAAKLFDFLGRLKRLKDRRPGTLIGVTGCVAQQEGEAIFRRAPVVDLVMGPRRLARLPALVEEARHRRQVMDTSMDDLTAIFWEGGEGARPGGKAYITIMEGCNMGCTFCIVPTTRGREVHRPLPEIVEEARRKVGEGVQEIELLGQTVNAYRDGRRAFHHLLEAVANIPGLARLRFTSSHPAFFTANTAAVMAAEPAICPQLHLPVQSGSDAVLRAMRRGYTAAEYCRRLEDLRRRVSHMSFSTDIIVGYPGESEADHQATLELLRHVRFAQIFAFQYSPRPGTAAAATSDDVPAQEKRRRLNEIFALQDGISMEENLALVGRQLPVLVDGPSRKDPEAASGRTPCNRVVNIAGLEPGTGMGRILQVEILAAHHHSLSGVPANAVLTSHRGDPICCPSSPA